MKKYAMMFLVATILIFSTLPSAFGVNNTHTTSNYFTTKEFSAQNLDETTIELNINSLNFETEIIDTTEGIFASISLPNFAYSMVKGQAKLPVIRKMIEIPYGSDPEITINSVSWEYTSLNELNLPARIIPAQQSLEKVPEPQDGFVVDEQFYSSDVFTPADISKIVEIGIMRARCFALVEISPLQYKPSTGELKLMSSCEIIINLPDSDMQQTYEKIQRYSTPNYEKIFESTFENYGFYEYGNLGRAQEGILFIVYDNYEDEIQDLVDMKESKGLDTTVTTTSDIPGGPTKENIKSYIQDAYDNWNIPPSYVLLVGDVPQIPTYIGSSSYSEADLYYVTLDGSDFIPEVHIGRFPGSSEAHIEEMVDKTVYYETGSFPSGDWIKHGTFIASSDHGQMAEQTHNYCIDNYLTPNGYTVDKIYEASGGNTQDIIDSLNEGSSLCIYSGHGYSGGWSCVPFNQNNVNSLTNEGMYPFVCSHACSTNPFGDSECFGETWLRAEDKGGIAFWGASASTYWDEDDILEKGMFQGWWEDGLEWIGGMTDMGLLYVYENYSGGGMSRYYFEAYNVNGDPSVKIWSENPSEPPEVPDKPSGEDEWTVNIETSFSSSTTDPEGDSIYYLFDWGDGSDSGWIGPYSSGVTVDASHTWTELGEYEVKVMAKDTFNAQSEWSEPTYISIIENNAPNDPTINGPTIVKPQQLATFTISATDSEGHDVYYFIHWGDGTYEQWFGPYSSGETVTVDNSWDTEGAYTIQVRAKDFIGDESAYTNHEITVSTSRTRNFPIFTQFFEKIISNFPILERILLNIF